MSFGMCKWGNTITVRVNVPADLSYTGRQRWAFKPIDACLAPLVRALNALGLHTRSCCCGHGRIDGHVLLQDGRWIAWSDQDTPARLAEALGDLEGTERIERAGALLAPYCQEQGQRRTTCHDGG